MKQCVRCGIKIDDNSLWCKTCRARVDEELKGQISRPFEYYFRHHLKRQRALDKKIDKILNE